MTEAVVFALGQSTASDPVPWFVRWFYELPNFMFLLILMGAMTLELLTCYALHRRRKKAFPLNRMVVGKFMLLALVAVAVMLDYLFIRLSPAGFRADLVRLMVVTQSTLVWLIIGEVLGVIGTVEKMQGSKAIPPVVLWTIRQLRRMDSKRYEALAPDGSPEAPKRRLYDRLSDEDLEALLAEMELRRHGKNDAPEG